MDENLSDSQSFSDSDCVLAAGTAKCCQSMLRSIMTSCLSQTANGSCHGLIGNFDETIGNFIGRHVLILDFLIDLLSEFLKQLLAGFGVQALILVLAKNLGEEVGQKASEEQVRVGDGEWSIFSVAHRSGMRAC